ITLEGGAPARTALAIKLLMLLCAKLGRCECSIVGIDGAGFCLQRRAEWSSFTTSCHAASSGSRACCASPVLARGLCCLWCRQVGPLIHFPPRGRHRVRGAGLLVIEMRRNRHNSQTSRNVRVRIYLQQPCTASAS